MDGPDGRCGLGAAQQSLQRGDDRDRRTFHDQQHVRETIRTAVVGVGHVAGADRVEVAEHPDPVVGAAVAAYVGEVDVVHHQQQVAQQPRVVELLGAVLGAIVISIVSAIASAVLPDER